MELAVDLFMNHLLQAEKEATTQQYSVMCTLATKQTWHRTCLASVLLLQVLLSPFMEVLG